MQSKRPPVVLNHVRKNPFMIPNLRKARFDSNEVNYPPPFAFGEHMLCHASEGHIMTHVPLSYKIYHIYHIYTKNFSRDSQNKNAPDGGGVQRTNKNEETSRSVKIQKDHMNKVLSVNKEALKTDITWTWGNMALSRIKTNEKIGC